MAGNIKKKVKSQVAKFRKRLTGPKAKAGVGKSGRAGVQRPPMAPNQIKTSGHARRGR